MLLGDSRLRTWVKTRDKTCMTRIMSSMCQRNNILKSDYKYPPELCLAQELGIPEVPRIAVK
ncbi:unnamed protein product [Periconia digitata]|uniref:Uncharacterized protein n=1 Tax=Periconia digitata TaxID=1303443 RepID=A0A9W4UFQ8_9PLEO|nr:unnamed protein product [Periconia digitata]